MAPPEWAVGEQHKRLGAFFPTYLEHGTRGTYQDCWPLLFIPWFATWPAKPIPLPNLDHVEVVPTPAAAPSARALTAKEAAAAKSKLKHEEDWRLELNKVRAMTTTERDKWCLGRGIEKKQQVC